MPHEKTLFVLLKERCASILVPYLAFTCARVALTCGWHEILEQFFSFLLGGRLLLKTRLLMLKG